MTETRRNPYVGPRAFTRGETIYGRDREVQRLLHLLIAERIVALYSPSGAGKTSLIQAGLLPRLEQEDFAVLPVVRVSLEPPAVAHDAPTSMRRPNRYIQSVILSLEEGQPSAERLSLDELASVDLPTYLDRRCRPEDGKPATEWVLVFDQFEEILTIDPTDEAARTEFFDQVGATLRDRRFWALFALREDYLAGLDPYVRPIPTRLHTTFRLDLLGPEAARLAVQQPAAHAGVQFEDAAAERLIDDLRHVAVQQLDGSMLNQLGPYVEPVQLQVVCRRLWDRLPAETAHILDTDIEAVGDVDQALAAYYADQVSGVAAQTNVPERAVREWVDHHLITDQGIRGQVLQGLDSSEGLSNAAILALVDTHLVRAERRRGFTWFELAHDRLVGPVRADNARWFEANLSNLQRAAVLWEHHDRPQELLVRGKAFKDAVLWAQAHEGELTSVERDFMAAARAVDEAAARDHRRVRWIQRLAVGAVLLALVSMAASVLAVISRDQAETAKNVANQRELVAEARDNFRGHLDLGLLLSLAAIHLSDTPEAQGALLDGLNFDPRLTRFLTPPGGEDGHSGRSRGLAFTDDGRLVSVVEDDSGQHISNNKLSQRFQTTVRMWDVASGVQVGQPITADASVGVAAFNTTPQQNLVATASEPTDRSAARIYLWDLDHSTQADWNPEQSVGALAFSKDGTLLAAGGCPIQDGCKNGQIRIWNVADRQQEGQQPARELALPTSVTSLAFSPDGKLLAAGTSDGTVLQWTVADWAAWRTPVKPVALPIKTLAYDPFVKYLAVGTDNPDVYFFDPNNPPAPGDPPKPTPNVPALKGQTLAINSIVFDPSSKSANADRLASASSDGSIALWQMSTRQQSDRPPLVGSTADVWNLAFRSNGQMLASAGTDGVIRVWQTSENTSQFPKTQKPLGTALPEPSPALGLRRMTFTHDGQQLAATTVNNSVLIWNVGGPADEKKPAPVEFKSKQSTIRDLDFSPDGSLLATAGCTNAQCQNGIVTFFDASTHDVDGSPLDLSGTPVDRIAFSPDVNSHLLISGAGDGSLRFWDVASRSQLGEPVLTQGAPTAVSSVAFSPDAKVFATTEVDGSVELWDVAKRERKVALARSAGAPGATNLAFNSDGTLLAAACNVKSCGAGKIYVWDLATDLPLDQARTGQSGPVTDVAFTGPSTLAAVSDDGTLRLWQVGQPGQPFGQPLFGYPFALTSVAFSPLTHVLSTSTNGSYGGNDMLNGKTVLWKLQYSDWQEAACTVANRNLSKAEWDDFVGANQPYVRLCAGLPPGDGAPE